MNEKEARRLVAERSGGLCERCGNNAHSIHHRRKKSHLSRADMYCPSNLVHLCGDGVKGCHGWSEANPSAAAEHYGLHVRPWQTPGDIPVNIYGTWYLLLPDGTKRETNSRQLAPEGGELRSGQEAEVPA